MTIRLMVVDDHNVVRAGLVQYFAMQPGIEVVAEAATGKELLEKLKAITVDILLLDMTMPGISGVERITAIRILYPVLPILVLSAHYDVQTVLCAMRAGASGYISKSCSPQLLLEAVEEVMVTGQYLSPEMAERLAYASVSMRTDNDERINSGSVIRLHGKTIDEWKEDCEIFYQEKVNEEKMNDELNKEIITLENELSELKEKIRRIEQEKPSGREPV